MKKNVALSALPALIISLAALGCATRAAAPRPGVSAGPGRTAASAQKVRAADAIEIPFPSRAGDRARYAMTQTRKDGSDESTMRTDVTVEIVRADVSGFLIAWTYGKWSADEPDEEPGPDERKLVDLTRSVRLLLRSEPPATGLKLENWEEIRARLDEGLKGIREQLRAEGAGSQEIEDFESALSAIYLDRNYMTAFYTKEATLFFGFLGQSIPVPGLPEFDVELPNPFGGDPLPGRSRLSVKSHDPARHRAVIVDTTTLDPARMPAIFEKIARDLIMKAAPELSAVVPDGSLFKALSIDAETELDLDLKSGWPYSLTYKTRTKIEAGPPGEASEAKEKVREETISMERIESEARPEKRAESPARAVNRSAGAEWRSLFRESQRLFRARDYGRAAELGKQALELAEKNVGPDHPDVASSLDRLGTSLSAQGRLAEAEPLFKRSLAVRESVYGPDHPDVAASLNNLADLLRSQGRHAEAEPLYERSLAVREKALGTGHPDTVTSMNNLAIAYSSQSRYAEAEPLYKRLLAIKEKALGPDHRDVEASVYNLAQVYDFLGRSAEAEALYRRSLAIREKVHGPSDPEVTPCLDNLARLSAARGRPAEAEALYKRSLAIQEKAIGPNEPSVPMSFYSLADFYRSQGRFEEAEALYKRYLARTERILGHDHLAVADPLNTLALFYLSQRRYTQAEPHLRRSLAIVEKARGPNHPEVATILEYLALLCRATDREMEAQAFERRLASIRSTKR